MSRREKLISRIRARPSETDFSDVQAVLEYFGWTFDREKGSHATFTKPGEAPLTVPKVGGRKVKRTYLTILCARLGLED